MFLIVRVEDTTFHFKYVERFANSTDSEAAIPKALAIPALVYGYYELSKKYPVNVR